MQPGEEPDQAQFPWEQVTQPVRTEGSKTSGWLRKDTPNWIYFAGGGGLLILGSVLLLVSMTPAPAVKKDPVLTATPTTIPAVSQSPPITERPRRPVRKTGTETKTTTTTTVVVENPIPTVPLYKPIYGPPAPIKEDRYVPINKQEIKAILKQTGRRDPFVALNPAKPIPIAPLPPPPNVTEPPKLQLLEPDPSLTALGYSGTAGWLAQVQVGEQTFDAYRGARISGWTVKSVGSNGVVLIKGKRTLNLGI